MSRLVGLDVLRGFAAFAVMLHHHGQYYDVLFPGRSPLAFDLGPGHFGVELFFIISGFVILMTLERKKTVFDFALSRFIRLMPAFLAALLAATVLLCIWPMDPPLDTPTVRRFVTNLTMAPSLFGELGVDLPYWTLTYELMFYGYMAVLLYFGQVQRVEWWGLAFVLAGALLTALIDEDQHRRISIVLLLNYSNFFLIGICLCRVYTGQARPITFIALTVSLLLTARGGAVTAFYAPGALYMLLTAAFTGLVLFASTKHGKLLVWPPLVFLGLISYPLYLIHGVWGFQIIRFGVENGWSTLTGVVIASAVGVVLAWLMYRYIELPSSRWLRKVTATWKVPHREVANEESVQGGLRLRSAGRYARAGAKSGRAS